MTFKIYTKTGDKGETALYGGTRVSKASARVDAYGTIDELNAFIGIAKSHIDDSDCLKQLAEIQYDLFTLGSEAATPIDKVYLANGKSRLPVTIKEEDIRDENGEYWQWSGDLCFMFPMLEMSGEEHYRFMSDVNYVYNAENPINEHKVDMSMVNDHATKIRNKKPYKKL